MNRGSTGPARRSVATRTRFNEAPIHESGKWQSQSQRQQQPQRASMRPRFMNRGSSADRILTISRYMTLQ